MWRQRLQKVKEYLSPRSSARRLRGKGTAVFIDLAAELIVLWQESASTVVASDLSIYALWAKSGFYILKGVF